MRASLLADSSNSVARTLSRRRFVNILQNFGFARLEVTPEQARIPSDAFDRVRVWLTKQLNLPKEKRWNEYVNESHEEEENVDKNAGNRLNASYSSVSRGRRVGLVGTVTENSYSCVCLLLQVAHPGLRRIFRMMQTMRILQMR